MRPTSACFWRDTGTAFFFAQPALIVPVLDTLIWSRERASGCDIDNVYDDAKFAHSDAPLHAHAPTLVGHAC
jgi:hypothetical protein